MVAAYNGIYQISKICEKKVNMLWLNSGCAELCVCYAAWPLSTLQACGTCAVAIFGTKVCFPRVRMTCSPRLTASTFLRPKLPREEQLRVPRTA